MIEMLGAILLGWVALVMLGVGAWNVAKSALSRR